MDRDMTTRTVGVLGAVALAVGLAGASVSACDLTSPGHFQQDSTRGSDSSDAQNSLSAAAPAPEIRDVLELSRELDRG
jgi:hypothetical protein